MKIFTKHTSTLLRVAVGTQCLAVVRNILTTPTQFHNVVNVHGFWMQQIQTHRTLVLLSVRYFPTVLGRVLPFGFERRQDRLDHLQLPVRTTVRVPSQKLLQGTLGHPSTVNGQRTGKLVKLDW
jgi:hypothetical protein